MSTVEETWDVAVIGAGAAGLRAAATLSRAGRRVLLIEARERIGGRILTQQRPELPFPLELGAEFIHGEAPATAALLREAGIPVLDSAGERWTRRDGQLSPRESLFEDVRRLLSRARLLDSDLSVEDFLARQAADPALAAACAYARMMVQGFDGADPRRASVRAIAEEWGGESLQGQYRPLGGYGAALTQLARTLDPQLTRLMLGSRVRQVSWDAHGVRLTATSARQGVHIRARRALVTLPLGVLQCADSDPAAVRFEPALTHKRAALEGLANGAVVKVLLQFRSAFWERLQQGRYADAGFLHAPGEDFPTFWSQLPLRAPLLTAWTGGPQAARLAGVGREDIIERALASADRLLDAHEACEREFVCGYVHDWSADPSSRGAYSYIAVGGSDAPAQLAEPLAETLFFAGEATHPEGAGTVEGALQSAERAARDILGLADR
ncbi:MAG TPA: NAD(P)/FAD-dependent oxidoreductase [Steroidobacteraceae bacterium]|nr:NAD(P)/FAD-dependent oxidoreductase [Steroidobacteraceae bacterium]